MNYIILDMEWDNAYCHRLGRPINQILQIGAVKLDEDFNICDTFEVNIRSSFTKKVSNRFALLTGITTEDMLKGIKLEEAFRSYNKWAGTDTVTLTWSNSDLYAIMQNEELLPKGVRMHIEKYMDLQKYIQNEMRLLGLECDGQISLAAAAEMLGVTTEGLELHTAKDDSLLSMALLKKHHDIERMQPYIKDTSAPDFYARLRFKAYYINDISDPHIDKKHFRFKCDVCGAKAKRCSDRYYRNRWFCAEYKCPECGRKFVGRVSFRKTYDDVIVKSRICEIKKKTEEDNQNEMQSLPETV